jgi:hypothetical protein
MREEGKNDLKIGHMRPLNECARSHCKVCLIALVHVCDSECWEYALEPT